MRASRPSELDVVGEAPRAAGGRRALRAGRRQLHESLHWRLREVRVREKADRRLSGTAEKTLKISTARRKRLRYAEIH